MKTGWVVAGVGALLVLMAAVAFIALADMGVVTVAVHWPGRGGANVSTSTPGAAAPGAAAPAPTVGAPGSAPGEGNVPAAPSPESIVSAAPQANAATAGATHVADMSLRITSPPDGSPLSVALLMSAKKRLGTTWRFTVNQLYVQGRSAIGDITNKDGGGRYAVVWGESGTVVWAEKYGSSKANAAAAASALPAAASRLTRLFDWHLSSPSDRTALKTGAGEAASAHLGKERDNVGAPYLVTSVRLATGPDGATWARVVLETKSGVRGPSELVELWLHRKGQAWSAVTQPAELPAPTSYFPQAVGARLFP